VVRVKVCGVTCVEDALACARASVDWIGLNFHPPSPRCVRPADAAAIVAALPTSTKGVGVFANRPASEVAEIAERVGLAIIQLHGTEPPEDLLTLDRFQIVRAFRLGGAAAWDAVNVYLERARELGRAPDAVLLDADRPLRLGGTGTTIPLELLENMPALPHVILAGGLTPRNVAERVARVRPWMVDVASGVESAPGRKDMARVTAFVRAARSAGIEAVDKSDDGL
jgi:phosphoribosylanthranilate isomerase